MQNYVEQEEFFISSLFFEDVILGARWFYWMAIKLKFSNRIISFSYRNRDVSMVTKDCGNMTPLVSRAILQKLRKKSVFFCLIFVIEHVSLQDSYAHVDLKDQIDFSNNYKDCFSNITLNELPPA